MTLSRGHVLGVVLALLAAGAVLALWPQEEPGVKEAITRKVVKMTDAAERKDMAELMDGVSDNFQLGPRAGASRSSRASCSARCFGATGCASSCATCR